MKSSDFFGALPEATRPLLPKRLQNFRVSRRSWLVQLYYAHPLLHYEVWNLGERRGKLEIGLHFESRNPDENERLLRRFQAHLFEIKTELGESVEAEAWDKGWTKVYEVIPLKSFTPEYLDQVAARLAQMIAVMQPLLERMTLPPNSKSRGR
jgi:hypothetical protein